MFLLIHKPSRLYHYYIVLFDSIKHHFISLYYAILLHFMVVIQLSISFLVTRHCQNHYSNFQQNIKVVLQLLLLTWQLRTYCVQTKNRTDVTLWTIASIIPHPITQTGTLSKRDYGFSFFDITSRTFEADLEYTLLK